VLDATLLPSNDLVLVRRHIGDNDTNLYLKSFHSDSDVSIELVYKGNNSKKLAFNSMRRIYSCGLTVSPTLESAAG